MNLGKNLHFNSSKSVVTSCFIKFSWPDLAININGCVAINFVGGSTIEKFMLFSFILHLSKINFMISHNFFLYNASNVL